MTDVRDEFLNLLDRLEAAWRRQGAPIADSLRPGLSDEEINALMAPTGLVMPTELRVWWAWHNGAGERDTVGPGSWLLVPLERALSIREMYVEEWSESVEPAYMPEAYWHSAWFPVTEGWGGKDFLYVDTSVATRGDPGPVRLKTNTWEDVLVDRARSFAETVELWVRLLEDGTFRWDATNEAWEDDWAAIPPELRASGLI